MKYTKQQEQEAREYLRSIIKAGDTLYTVLRHVSSSGMSRNIDVYAMINNEPRWLTHYASIILGYSRSKDGALRVGGCGMDMGFHVVYTMSRRLFADGVPCTGDGCNSNDHVNGDRDYTKGKKHMHSDGGYAINQKWL